MSNAMRSKSTGNYVRIISLQSIAVITRMVVEEGGFCSTLIKNFLFSVSKLGMGICVLPTTSQLPTYFVRLRSLLHLTVALAYVGLCPAIVNDVK